MDPEQFARLIEILGLTAAQAATAEGEEPAAPEPVTADQVLAKVEELVAAAGTAADTGTQLATATAELERIQGEYRDLMQREEEARKIQRDAEVDEILKPYADRISTPEAMAAFRNVLIADRESGLAMLNGLPAAAAPVEETPPGPIHPAPGETTTEGPTEQEKLAEQNKLIASIRKEVRDGATPFAAYDDARFEARRRKPDLFA